MPAHCHVAVTRRIAELLGLEGATQLRLTCDPCFLLGGLFRSGGIFDALLLGRALVSGRLLLRRLFRRGLRRSLLFSLDAIRLFAFFELLRGFLILLALLLLDLFLLFLLERETLGFLAFHFGGIGFRRTLLFHGRRFWVGDGFRGCRFGCGFWRW